ncbi:MAG TPA: Holliday junction resolvase RuvX [Vicinamibacterales bacterium]|nr:Holliday junction resolvase RuvX [Vicinamibacterales bacterium]
MRFLGVDFGRRRIGLAVSDATGVLARPWRTIGAGATPRASAAELATLIEGEPADADLSELGGVVVGLPRKLGGEDTDQTGAATEFARALGDLTHLEVHLQDERLTSHEADARLAEREKDWRKRKVKLDAAAAAIILQDFLDARMRRTAASADKAQDAGC